MNDFKLPLCMIVEEGVVERVDEVISLHVPKLDKQGVIIVTDKIIQGLYPKQIEKMAERFDRVKVYLVEEGSFQNAVELARYICIKGYSLVIGFGGGKVLDMAKYASFVSKTKYFAVPTVLSHDGLVSPIAVLSFEGDRRKSFGCQIPTGIIVDINIILNAPEDLLKSGIGDTVSNYTALYDWKLDCRNQGKAENDFAYLLSDMSFNSLLYNDEKSLKSKNFIKMLTQALVLSGLAMEIAGNSRPCSGSEHLFSHALDEHYKEIRISHGMAVAMGSIGACYLQKRDYKILMDYLETYGININPMNWGITKEIFIDAWMKAKDTRKDRYTILNEVELSPELLEKIYDIIMEEKK